MAFSDTGTTTRVHRVIGGSGTRMFRHIGKDEAGVSAPEYAVLLLLLVGSLVLAVGGLNGATTAVFNNAANGINDAAAASGPSSAGNGGTTASSPANSPSSSPSNPPSSNGGGHDPPDTPGHDMHKTPCATPGAKCFAPGHTK